MVFMFYFGGLNKRHGRWRKFQFKLKLWISNVLFIVWFWDEIIQRLQLFYFFFFKKKTSKNGKMFVDANKIQIRSCCHVDRVIWMMKTQHFISMWTNKTQNLWKSIKKHCAMCACDKPTMFKHYESKWKFLISKHVEYKINVKNPDSKRSPTEREWEWRERVPAFGSVYSQIANRRRTHIFQPM